MFDYLIESAAKNFSGTLALAYYDFQDGSSFVYQATKPMRSASLIKLPLLVQTLTEVAKGELSLKQRLLLKQDDQVSGAGILHSLDEGLELSLHDVLTLMIIVSDNTATNLIIDLLGIPKINTFMQALGLEQTKLIGKLQLPENKQNEAQRQGKTNQCCAADILGLLIQLEKRDLLPDDLTEVALKILKKQQFTEALARYLPTDTELFDKAVTVASKSGCLRGLWHDAGIIYNHYHEALYGLVIMTDHSKDKSYSWEQEGMLLIAHLSKAIYEARIVK